VSSMISATHWRGRVSSMTSAT